jgi:chemotaxis protein CheZ
MTADAISTGDSPELEELFDSIVHGHEDDAANATGAAVASNATAQTTGEGDSAELEELFDSVAQEQQNKAGITGVAAPGAEAAPETEGEAHICSATKVINSVGHLTRQLHDTLAELGYDRQIQECAAASLPDARQRLSYVVTLTEQAASRALNAVDLASPMQDALAAEAASLTEEWDRILAGQADLEHFKRVAQSTREYLGTVGERTEATRGQLREIVMAQEFQDLTGQVLKRITDLVHTLETQLLTLLVENAQAPVRRPDALGLLNGPVVGTTNVSEVVTNQAQVDELLESLGF